MRTLNQILESAFRSSPRRVAAFLAWLAVASTVFLPTLLALARCSLTDDLYSHVWLIPAVSLWLLILRRHVFALPYQAGAGGVVSLAATGSLLDACRRVAAPSLANDDAVALSMAAFVCLVVAGFLFCFGRQVFRRSLFPLAFLFLMMPVPSLGVRFANHLLQNMSTDFAYAWISLAGVPVFRDNLVLQMPGLTFEVAEQCSGIRSSLVLLIASLVAGRLLLISPWRRLVLVLVVLPLGVLRNSLRIFLLAFLAVRVDPDVMRSVLHRRGGQPFFLLSLLLLMAILLWLRRAERRRDAPCGAERGPA